VGVEWLMWSEKLRVWWGQLNLAHITETKKYITRRNYNKKMPVSLVIKCQSLIMDSEYR